jgi:hypothetical protein
MEVSPFINFILFLYLKYITVPAFVKELRNCSDIAPKVRIENSLRGLLQMFQFRHSRSDSEREFGPN